MLVILYATLVAAAVVASTMSLLVAVTLGLLAAVLVFKAELRWLARQTRRIPASPVRPTVPDA